MRVQAGQQHLLFPSASWADLLKVQFSTDFLAPTLALTLLSSMFPSFVPRRPAEITQVFGTLMAVSCVFLPSYWLEQLVLVTGINLALACLVGMFVLTRAAVADAPQARLLLVAVGVFFGAAFHDVLVALRWVYWELEVVGAGFIVLVFAEAYALARIVSDSTRRVERMSSEVVAAHDNLLNVHAAVVRFVPVAFLELLGRSSIAEVQRGDHVEMNVEVLFCDIRGSTRLVEELAPSEAFQLINGWLGTLEPYVHEEGASSRSTLETASWRSFHPGPTRH